MSTARKCDCCEALYEPGEGTIVIDLMAFKGLDRDKEPSYATWSGIDLCTRCTEQVMPILKKSIQIDGDQTPDWLSRLTG